MQRGESLRTQRDCFSLSFVPPSLWHSVLRLILWPHICSLTSGLHPYLVCIFPINIFLLYLFLCSALLFFSSAAILCVVMWAKFWSRWELSWRQWLPCNCNVEMNTQRPMSHLYLDAFRCSAHFFFIHHHLVSLDNKRGFYSTPDLLELHVVFTVWETANTFALPQTGKFCPVCQSQTIREQTEKVGHFAYRANLLTGFLPFDPQVF